MVLGLLWAACGSSGGTAPTSECSVDADCERMAQGVIETLLAPTGRSLRLDGASCEPNGSRTPGACMCSVAEGTDGTWTFSLGQRRDCDRYGRSGDCIAPAEDFSGCDVATASSCDAPCASALAIIEADEDAAFDAVIRTTTCVSDTSDLRTCHTVQRVDDRCYAGVLSPYGLNEAYDCALTDDEIIRLEAARIGARP